MFSKGQKVRVKAHQRTKTIFNQSEVTPGKTTSYKGGRTGTVTNIFDGGVAGDIVEVRLDGNTDDYREYSPDELEAI